MSDLPELQDVITITKQAGCILLEKFDTGLEIGLKGADEIVTEADRASEAFLLERLPNLLPRSGFFGEETGYHPGDSGMTWVVDPLDGTHNYALGIPLWACSVALLNPDHVPVLGVLDFPYLKKTLWARLGGGAFQNGKPIRVSSEPLEATSAIGVQSKIRMENFPDHIEKISKQYSARTLGAIAYSAAMVAMGRLRACMDLKVKLHDIAAATVIVEEAGGWTSDLDGKRIFPLQKEYEELEGYPLPFFAGDPETGPGLLQFLFPNGTPPEIYEPQTR